ncbi:class D sortase [Alicyclobacillus dauci]|uniref:Class D sortase n=1 Tax=Alicyclobacillus dauci TaxID=1475485 RepID=A0ABY6Z394_9BACL|nr:class D sortase [Alicyclobacillus dauci]WAH36764.1 class D sortase [Alicyclobacillus dauci]
MKSSKIVLFLGLGCLLVGAGVIANLGWFYLNSYTVGKQLLTNVTGTVSTENTTGPVENIPTPKLDGLVGKLHIPALALDAPVVEGTDDKEINVAVGHLATSVMPGEKGTSVLAAHNATWFRHINQLSKGDVITMETKSGTFLFKVSQAKIMHTGDPIYNTSNPSIVLESCYPLDALYLTPYRYLVYANMIQQVGSSNPRASVVSDAIPSITYTAEIPDEIRKQGVTLQTNSLPMGSLHYEGSPSNDFVQSNSPLNAASEFVQLYLAWLHASSSKDSAALASLLKKGVQNNPLYGYPINRLSYQNGFNVTLDVDGTALVHLTATTMIKANATYHVEVNAAVEGNQIHLESVDVHK